MQASAESERLAELRASETQLRLLTDYATDLILRFDHQRRIVFASPAARRWGYEPADLVGQSMDDFVHPDDLADALDWLARLMAGELTRSDEQHQLRCRGQDGAWIWFEGNPALIRQDDGEVVGFVASLRDITERKASETALREHQDLFEAAFEQSAIGKVVLDRTGTIVRVNQAICDILGYAKEELLGLTDNDLAHPEEIGQFDDQFQAIAQGLTRSYRVERRYRRRDATFLWFSLLVSMVHAPDGTPRLIVAELQDLTERHATESELRRKRGEAEAAVVAKSEFLSNMSHELRTPLTGIIGFGGLLEQMNGLPDRAKVYVSRIVSGGDALLSIVNNILDFTKLEAGHVVLDRQPFDPRFLVEDASHLVKEEANKKGLGLRIEFDHLLPETVTVDAARIRQVLLNLLSNAVKFTKQGEVVVSVGPDGRGGALRFAVRDTGIGIQEALSHRLFQRFSQIDGSISREYGGTGLGLAISKGLVELMGGQIGFESRESIGSTFWFTVAAADPVPAPAMVASPTIIDTDPVGRKPLRILIVDDVAMNRELLVEMLRGISAELVEASNGREAVAASMQSDFDLILMDLQMPGMDGYAATRAIRANSERNGATPILGVSANVLPKHIEAGWKAGLNGYVAKPIDPKTLRDKITQFSRGEARSPDRG